MNKLTAERRNSTQTRIAQHETFLFQMASCFSSVGTAGAHLLVFDPRAYWWQHTARVENRLSVRARHTSDLAIFDLANGDGRQRRDARILPNRTYVRSRKHCSLRRAWKRRVVTQAVGNGSKGVGD